MKIGYFYISHIINDYVCENFFNIKNAVQDENIDVIFCNPNGNLNSIDVYDYLNNSKYCFLNIDRDDFIDHNNYCVTKNHQIYLAVYDIYKTYDYYWFIEYDVQVNNLNKLEGYKKLFDFYKTNDSDLICCNIHNWKYNIWYQKRYPEELMNNYKNINNNFLYKDNKIQTDNLYFGFFTICRISNRLLSETLEYYKNNDGFFEYVIPSLAKYKNQKICSFNDDKFNIENTHLLNEHMINTGSNGWNVKNLNTDDIVKHKHYFPEYPKNVIIHPIKNLENNKEEN